MVMEIEFDPQKAASNYRKHHVDFEEATTCFFDPLALSTEDPFSLDENRWVLIGISIRARHLTVVYTLRNNRIRMISARKSTRREIEHHAQGI